jgi:hypothetical protein
VGSAWAWARSCGSGAAWHACRLEPELRRGTPARARFIVVDGTLVGDELTPADQERRRVFAQDRQRGKGARGHEVVAAEALGPVLRARVNDLGVGEAGRCDRAREVAAAATRALDQRNLRPG